MEYSYDLVVVYILHRLASIAVMCTAGQVASNKHLDSHMLVCYNSRLIYRAGPGDVTSLVVKRELGVILYNLERLWVAIGAVQVPHLVVSPFKIAHPSSCIK